MSDSYISAQLRRAVKERAKGACEYCGVSDDVTLAPHEPDHIIAEQHGGATELENLAYACFRCNRFKGSNIATVDPQAGVLVPLYQPRSDHWHDHFNFIPDSALINLRQKTPPFRCTVRAGDEWRSGSPCAILSTYRRACGN